MRSMFRPLSFYVGLRYTGARALLRGRLAPSTEDVAALAEPVLKHRMALSFAARADGHTLEGLIKTLADQAA